MQLRGEILRELRELKDLKDANVLDDTQFENEKRILLTELNGLITHSPFLVIFSDPRLHLRNYSLTRHEVGAVWREVDE